MGRVNHQGHIEGQGPPQPVEQQRRRVADQGGDRQGGSGAGGVQKGEARSHDRELDKKSSSDNKRSDRSH